MLQKKVFHILCLVIFVMFLDIVKTFNKPNAHITKVRKLKNRQIKEILSNFEKCWKELIKTFYVTYLLLFVKYTVIT